MWTWAAVGTATLGFVAAQAGGFLQFRRDQRAQHRRDEAEASRQDAMLAAESMRLREQLDAEARRLKERLEAQSVQAEEARKQGDITEWRERRLELYRSTSVLFSEFMRILPGNTIPHGTWNTNSEARIGPLMDELVANLDLCELTSERRLRAVTEDLRSQVSVALAASNSWRSTRENIDKKQEYLRNNPGSPDSWESDFLKARTLNDVIELAFIPRESMEELHQLDDQAHMKYSTAMDGSAAAYQDWLDNCRVQLGIIEDGRSDGGMP